MALAQGLCLASGTAEICPALRKVTHGALAGLLHVSHGLPAKGVGAVSSPGRGSVAWALVCAAGLAMCG